MKLGKLPFRPDHRDLLFSTYAKPKPHPQPALPVPPAEFGHEQFILPGCWGMLANDTVGDCTCAGADHEVMLWTAAGKHPASFTANGCIDDYAAITGYNGTEATDQGAEVRDVLKYRSTVGMKDCTGSRHTIGAYVRLGLRNDLELATALYLFGVVGLGVEIPQSAMTQTDKGQPWDVPKRNSPIEGGHYVPLVARRGGYWWVVTWGALQAVTTAFLHKYADELWAMLSVEMLINGTASLEGFNLVQLEADLAAVQSL